MANQGIPPRFQVANQGEVACTQFDQSCARIVFTPPGAAPPTTWSVTPVPGSPFFAFQQSETGYYATAVDGLVRACPQFSDGDQSSWQVVRNPDGTHLVVLNSSRIIWTVKPDGSLGLGPAIAGPTNSFTFIPA